VNLFADLGEQDALSLAFETKDFDPRGCDPFSLLNERTARSLIDSHPFMQDVLPCMNDWSQRRAMDAFVSGFRLTAFRMNVFRNEFGPAGRALRN
jgi:hypothetical protein